MNYAIKIFPHLIFSLIFFTYAFSDQKNFVLMLDPAGDAKNSGRRLDDGFERGITFQFAEELEKMIKSRFAGVQVMVTRFPGETVQPLQNANFANRLAVDLFLSINFYQERGIKPQLAIYYFGYHELPVKMSELAFHRYDAAHMQQLPTTQRWSALMHQALQDQSYQSLFECIGVMQLPFKPLVGIKAPAIALEMSVKSKNDFTQYLEPVLQSLEPIIAEVMQRRSS